MKSFTCSVGLFTKIFFDVFWSTKIVRGSDSFWNFLFFVSPGNSQILKVWLLLSPNQKNCESLHNQRVLILSWLIKLMNDLLLYITIYKCVIHKWSLENSIDNFITEYKTRIFFIFVKAKTLWYIMISHFKNVKLCAFYM